MRATRIRVAVTAIALTMAAAFLSTGGGEAATPLRAHVYAPYFET